MHVMSRESQPARWRVSLDVARELHHALYFREALRLPVLPDVGLLTHQVAALTAESGHLVGAWNQWWATLLARLVGGPAVSAAHGGESPSVRDASLGEVVAGHETEYRRWWMGSGRISPGQKMLLAGALRQGPRHESELLASRGRPVSLSVDVLALDGVFAHAVSRDHVVVSNAFRRTADYAHWLAATVFPD